MEILDERMVVFCSEMVAMMRALTLTFREFRECGSLKFFGKKDSIVSRRWLVDVRKAFQYNLFPEEAKVRLASCFLKDINQDWWEEVGHTLGSVVIELMIWEDFVIRFQAEFAPMIEVQ